MCVVLYFLSASIYLHILYFPACKGTSCPLWHSFLFSSCNINLVEEYHLLFSLVLFYIFSSLNLTTFAVFAILYTRIHFICRRLSRLRKHCGTKHNNSGSNFHSTMESKLRVLNYRSDCDIDNNTDKCMCLKSKFTAHYTVNYWLSYKRAVTEYTRELYCQVSLTVSITIIAWPT